jgi:two-component system NtrC family sensor kinase
VATLMILQGPDKGRTLKTVDSVVLIGRGSEQIPLTDQTISRRHAEMQRSESGWTLRDLGSANGTFVNGGRIGRPVRLKHGDQIRLGSTLMVYMGDEKVQQLTGSMIPHDLVSLDAGSLTVDSSIVASLPSSEDSVVMAAPETQSAVKAWNVLRELSAVIGSFLNAEELLVRVMDVVFEQLDVDHAVIFVRDEATNELLPEVVRFRHRPTDGSEIMPAIATSRTIINHVVEQREGVLCSNAVTDERFRAGKSVQNLGMRSVICAPIVARDQILGVIHLDSPVTNHIYTEQELRLLTAIGLQTGMAMENARLVQAQLQRERLAAAGETVAYLSHYIKNILQGMRIGADVVERGLTRRDLTVAEQGWRIVAKNLDKSYNLMLNMLAFSKQREPKLEMLQVNRIVEDAVQLAHAPADDARVVLLSDLDENAPPIPADADGIHQVVLNLVTNAIDACKAESGVINVRTRFEPEARRMLISVRDNGPGVPSDLRQQVFEPFKSTKGQGGTGLGLAVSKKIVEEQGGTIELHHPEDGGAEFRVYLPATRADRPGMGDTLTGGRLA